MNRNRASEVKYYTVSTPAWTAAARRRVAFDSETQTPIYMPCDRLLKGSVWNFHQLLIQPWNTTLENYAGVVTRRSLLTNRAFRKQMVKWSRYQILGVKVEYLPAVSRPTKPSRRPGKQYNMTGVLDWPRNTQYSATALNTTVPSAPGDPDYDVSIIGSTTPFGPGTLTVQNPSGPGDVVAVPYNGLVAPDVDPSAGVATVGPTGNISGLTEESWLATRDRYKDKMMSVVWNSSNLMNYRGVSRAGGAATGSCIDGGYPDVINYRTGGVPLSSDEECLNRVGDSVPQLYNELDWKAEATCRRHSPYRYWKRYMRVNMPESTMLELAPEGASQAQLVDENWIGPSTASNTGATTRAFQLPYDQSQFKTFVIAAENVAVPSQAVQRTAAVMGTVKPNGPDKGDGFWYTRLEEPAGAFSGLDAQLHRFGRYRIRFRVKTSGLRNHELNERRQALYRDMGVTKVGGYVPPSGAGYAKPFVFYPGFIPQVGTSVPVAAGDIVDPGYYGGTIDLSEQLPSASNPVTGATGEDIPVGYATGEAVMTAGGNRVVAPPIVDPSCSVVPP